MNTRAFLAQAETKEASDGLSSEDRANAYSVSDLKRDGETVWDGVTNPAAVKHLREMHPKDRLVIYHTGEERAAVGTATVIHVDRKQSKSTTGAHSFRQNDLAKDAGRSESGEAISRFAAGAPGQAVCCPADGRAIQMADRNLDR